MDVANVLKYHRAIVHTIASNIILAHSSYESFLKNGREIEQGNLCFNRYIVTSGDPVNESLDPDTRSVNSNTGFADLNTGSVDSYTRTGDPVTGLFNPYTV